MNARRSIRSRRDAYATTTVTSVLGDRAVIAGNKDPGETTAASTSADTAAIDFRRPVAGRNSFARYYSIFIYHGQLMAGTSLARVEIEHPVFIMCESRRK